MLGQPGLFFSGGGGGAHLKNRDQIVNVGMIRHASSKEQSI